MGERGEPANLEFIAVRRFKEQGGRCRAVARSLVRRLMTDLLSRVKVLSNRGYDQDDLYARARDFEDAQIAASARCLTAGQVCIVSSDAASTRWANSPFAPLNKRWNGYLDGEAVLA
jgi:hypothetical protein